MERLDIVGEVSEKVKDEGKMRKSRWEEEERY